MLCQKVEEGYSYPLLILISPAFNVISPVFKSNVVFRKHMLCERKFRKTGETLIVSRNFLIHHWGTQSNAFFVVNPSN